MIYFNAHLTSSDKAIFTYVQWCQIIQYVRYILKPVLRVFSLLGVASLCLKLALGAVASW